MKQVLLLSIGITIGMIIAYFAIKYKNKVKDDSFSIYMPTDIIHVDDNALTISFESNSQVVKYNSEDELYETLETITGNMSSIEEYYHDLDYQIRNGYVYARTVYNDDEQYTDLILVQKDTNILISTFNIVEKIYNPKTKSIEYDSYSID